MVTANHHLNVATHISSTDVGTRSTPHNNQTLQISYTLVVHIDHRGNLRKRSGVADEVGMDQSVKGWSIITAANAAAITAINGVG